MFSRLLSEAAPSQPSTPLPPFRLLSSSSFQCTWLVADWSPHPLMGVCCACVVCLVQRGAPLLVPPLLHPQRRRVALVYATRHAFLAPPPLPLPLPLPPLPPFLPLAIRTTWRFALVSRSLFSLLRLALWLSRAFAIGRRRFSAPCRTWSPSRVSVRGAVFSCITFARVSGNGGRVTGILSLVFVAFTTLIMNIGVRRRRLTRPWRRRRVLSLRQRW